MLWDHQVEQWNHFGAKEKSFIENCLRVDPTQRLSACQLLDRTLFDTGHSTVSARSMDNTSVLESKLQELTRQISYLPAGVSVKELEERLSDVMTVISSQIREDQSRI